MPGTNDHGYLGLPLWPISPSPMYTHLHTFIFSLIPFLGGVAVGCSHCCVWLAAWMHAEPFLWIALATAGVTTVPREPSGTNQQPVNTFTCLFSLLPLWGQR
jgi:hypothetical protein